MEFRFQRAGLYERPADPSALWKNLTVVANTTAVLAFDVSFNDHVPSAETTAEAYPEPLQ